MMDLLVSFVTSSLKTGWKSEVDYLFIHGCKSRDLFRNSDVRFRIFFEIKALFKRGCHTEALEV